MFRPINFTSTSPHEPRLLHAEINLSELEAKRSWRESEEIRLINLYAVYKQKLAQTHIAQLRKPRYAKHKLFKTLVFEFNKGNENDGYAHRTEKAISQKWDNLKRKFKRAYDIVTNTAGQGGDSGQECCQYYDMLWSILKKDTVSIAPVTDHSKERLPSVPERAKRRRVGGGDPTTTIVERMMRSNAAIMEQFLEEMKRRNKETTEHIKATQDKVDSFLEASNRHIAASEKRSDALLELITKMLKD